MAVTILFVIKTIEFICLEFRIYNFIFIDINNIVLTHVSPPQNYTKASIFGLYAIEFNKIQYNVLSTKLKLTDSKLDLV